jgi:hypothetical protein
MRWRAARNFLSVLIVARGDAAELFKFAKEILDQVACLVERVIDLAGHCSVLPRPLSAARALSGAE